MRGVSGTCGTPEMAAKISRVATLGTALAGGTGGSPFLAFPHPGQMIPLTGVSTSLLCKVGSEGLGAAGGPGRPSLTGFPTHLLGASSAQALLLGHWMNRSGVAKTRNT